MDGLDRLQAGEVGKRRDVVGMDHLHLAAETLDPAADNQRLALGQYLVQVVLAGVEEHQMEEAGVVGAAHLVGQAGRPRRQVRLDAHGDGGDAPARRLRYLGREAAGDQPGGQMPQQIGDARPGDLGHELAQPGADAGQSGDLGEQGKQDLRAARQASGLPRPRRSGWTVTMLWPRHGRLLPFPRGMADRVAATA